MKLRHEPHGRGPRVERTVEVQPHLTEERYRALAETLRAVPCESEARYREAERIARLIHWSVALSPDGKWENNVVTYSDGAVEMFGIAEHERKVKNAETLAWVHPDDRESLRTALINGVENRQREFS